MDIHAKKQYYKNVNFKLKTLWPLFIDGVQLPQGYRATLRRQFTFYHLVPRSSWYSFYQPWKDERLSQPWSHPVVLNTGPLDWESSALTTRPLLKHEKSSVAPTVTLNPIPADKLYNLYDTPIMTNCQPGIHLHFMLTRISMTKAADFFALFLLTTLLKLFVKIQTAMPGVLLTKNNIQIKRVHGKKPLQMK